MWQLNNKNVHSVSPLLHEWVTTKNEIYIYTSPAGGAWGGQFQANGGDGDIFIVEDTEYSGKNIQSIGVYPTNDCVIECFLEIP